jgi:cell surface protein SprA
LGFGPRNGNLQEQKTILGVRDLGEGSSGTPDNSQSGVYTAISSLSGVRDVNTYNSVNNNNLPTASNAPYQDGEHFIFNRKAKRLNSSEYTYNPQLGYISLNQRLNDNQLLAVSFSYTLSGDSKVYKVEIFRRKSCCYYETFETKCSSKNIISNVEFDDEEHLFA